jgi:ribosomal protein S18 acetylase RimI-like enzyme
MSRAETWTSPVTDELIEALDRLVPQLSRSSPPPGRERLQEMLDAPAVELFVARDEGGRIVGTATLVTFPVPTGRRAWIEDVVVDEAAGRQGYGSALTAAMLERARQLGCVTVDLTSRPSRVAANHMYLKLGFQRRETNVYRYQLR